jgi:hypothetical protein
MADAKLKLGDSTPQHVLLHIDSKLADRIFSASPDCSDIKTSRRARIFNLQLEIAAFASGDRGTV